LLPYALRIGFFFAVLAAALNAASVGLPFVPGGLGFLPALRRA